MSKNGDNKRGIHTLLNSQTMVHTNESLDNKYFQVLKRKSGANYMMKFKRPAYLYTSLQQKDIHGVMEDK